MTEEGIYEIDYFPGPYPTDVHQDRRKEGSEHPQAIADQKGFESVAANPLEEGLSRRTDVCGN